jgi:hypothetical protein
MALWVNLSLAVSAPAIAEPLPPGIRYTKIPSLFRCNLNSAESIVGGRLQQTLRSKSFDLQGTCACHLQGAREFAQIKPEVFQNL